jgi:hypothetical protein
MHTPFEDLEYLADFLPEEGEAVVVTRRHGELVCRPLQEESFREGVTDAELYGRLVLANERLNACGTIPLWIGALVALVLCLAYHEFTGIGWEGWYVDASIAFFAGLGAFTWIGMSRRRIFERDIRPMLEDQVRRRGINRYALIGSIRQHAEMRTLLDDIARWTK